MSLSATDIYDFAGWLTTRPGTLTIGSSHEAGPMADAVVEYLRAFPERFRQQPAVGEVIETDSEYGRVTVAELHDESLPAGTKLYAGPQPQVDRGAGEKPKKLYVNAANLWPFPSTYREPR